MSSCRSFFCYSTAAILFLHFALLQPQCLKAQDREFKEGDIVAFDFLGKEKTGEVVGFTGTGWPRVEFEYSDRTIVRFFPPSQLELAEANPTAEIPGPEMRTWVDATGKFKVKAKILSFKNGKVELEKEDGMVVTLPSTGLSDADQDYLKQLQLAKSPGNPFAGGESRTRKSNNARAVKSIQPDPDSNEVVLSADDWNVTPDVAAQVSPSNKIINLPKSGLKNPFHNRRSPLSFSVENKMAAFSNSNPFDKSGEVYRINLAEATANVLPFSRKDNSLMAISPSGTIVVTKNKDHQKGKMEFWSVKDNEMTPIESWETASFHNRTGFAPKLAMFLDESRLLTIGRRVALFDRETASAIYSYRIDGTTAFSPNRKHIAVVTDGQVIIADIETGEGLGTLDGQHNDIGGLVFSPDGKFLAGYSSASGEIRLWELDGGKLVRRAATPGGSASGISWAGDKYLLMNQRYLMDMELRACVWRYEKGRGSIVSTGGNLHWYFDGKQLKPLRLPPKNIAAKTADLDPDQLLMLQPGSAVAVKLELPFSPAEKKKIESAIKSSLEDQGFEVAASADVVLTAKVTKHKQETQELSEFHDPFGRRGTRKVTYTPKTSTVTLTNKGKTFWTKSMRHDVVGVLMINGDESAQQAANRVCEPNPRFFSSIKFPAYAASLPENIKVGISQLTGGGVQ